MNEIRKTPWGLWIAAVLLLVLVVYPLSIGPSAYVFTKYGAEIPEWAHTAYVVFYAPIHWLADPSRGGGETLFSKYWWWWVYLALDK